MRIGLANLPLLLALDILGPLDFFLLALLKVLGQGILGGTLFSYIFFFSLAGTFTSAALMYILRSLLGKKHLGFAGIGCAGAMASNGIQLLLAHYFIFGNAIRYLIPPFLASGFITGIALGILCEYFCRRSIWYAKHSQCTEMKNITKNITTEDCCPTDSLEFTEEENKNNLNSMLSAGQSRISRSEEQKPNRQLRVLRVLRGLKFLNSSLSRPKRSERWYLFFRAEELFFCGFIMALIFLFGSSFYGRIVQFLFFCLLVWLSGKKNNIFITCIIMAGVVFVNLLAPYGKIIAELGPLRITQGSLSMGLEKAVTLEALVMLSRACIKSDLKLPGTIGSLLGESFRLLEQMRENIKTISRGHIIDGIDKLMLKMETVNSEDAVHHDKPKRNIRSILVLIVMVLLVAVLGRLKINILDFL
jgi:heptaprenyl diphosphate synthase